MGRFKDYLLIESRAPDMEERFSGALESYDAAYHHAQKFKHGLATWLGPSGKIYSTDHNVNHKGDFNRHSDMATWAGTNTGTALRKGMIRMRQSPDHLVVHLNSVPSKAQIEQITSHAKHSKKTYIFHGKASSGEQIGEHDAEASPISYLRDIRHTLSKIVGCK